MAQLKDSVVQGSLRVTDTTYTNDLIVGDTTAPTIANNDYLLVADASDGNKLLKGPTFDGLTVSKALTQKGTWENFTANTGTVTSITIKTTAPLTGGSNTATTTSGSYTIALANQNANLVLAGPESGSATAPAFRQLKAADLPTATTAALGIVKVGTNIGVSSGTISVATATTAALGVVKVGSNINVASGVISVSAASTSVLGVTQYGTAANTALQGNQNLFSLNGATKNAAAAASFYAPAAAGTKDQVLVSTAGAPTWRNDRGIEFIRGEWSAASGTWIGTTQDAALYDGKQIILYMPFAGSGNATLELTLNGVAVGTAGAATTGVKNVYFESSNRFTTHKGQNAQIHLIYHSGLKLSNGTTYEGWWYLANRDTNDNTIAYQLRYNRVPYTIDGTVSYYKILLQKADGNLTPISTKGNSQGTGDSTIYEGDFMIFGEYLYYSGTTAAVSGSNLWEQIEIDIRYTFNCGATLTAGKDVYLVAQVDYPGSVYAKIYAPKITGTEAACGAANSCITQTLPSTSSTMNADSQRLRLIYIKLGIAYSTSAIIFTKDHPVYWLCNEGLKLYPDMGNNMFIASIGLGEGVAGVKETILDIAKNLKQTRMFPIQFYLSDLDITNSSIRHSGYYQGLLNFNTFSSGIIGDIIFWRHTNYDVDYNEIYKWSFNYTIATNYVYWNENIVDNTQIYNNQTVFNDFTTFEQNIIKLAHINRGKMVPIVFAIPRPETSNGFRNTNLRRDSRNTVYYTGFIKAELPYTISGSGNYIEGSLIFWDKYNDGSSAVNTSTNPTNRFSEDVYLWQFVGALSTNSGTWTFNKIKNKKTIKNLPFGDDRVLTLVASAWQGTGPYTIAMTTYMDGISYSPGVDYIVGLADTCTAEEYEAAAAAQLLVTHVYPDPTPGYDGLQIEVTAFGEKPEVNIHLSIIAVVR